MRRWQKLKCNFKPLLSYRASLFLPNNQPITPITDIILFLKDMSQKAL